MANFTKTAIKDTFLKILEERPLSDITVKTIVERCGINRNSFYYHYANIPSLLEEIIREDAEAIIQSYPSVTTIVECFDAVTEFASRRKKVIMHIYRSVGREVFEQHLMMVCEYFVQSYADTVIEEDPIREDDKKAVVNYYKCVCFGVIIDWLNNGMEQAYTKSIRKIFLLKKDLAMEIAALLKDQI